MNPFIIRGYKGRSFFCDREKETEAIIKALHNGRDVTLVSLRKMGKTGLILHTFEKLKKEKTCETLYLDIYHTENLNGLINQLASALFRIKRSFGEKMREFLHNFRYLRPIISVDQLTGLPSVSFQVADEKEARSTLEELFAILQERGTKIPIVIAIDEFQQIGNYPEQNVEAMIRGMIQTLGNIRFIFSGSNKTILSRMFGDATRPFYQSTEMMYLFEINPNLYEEFIKTHFLKNSRQVEVGIVTEILHWSRCHTWYVQYLCNKLYETGHPVSMEILKSTQQVILTELEPFYLEFRNLLTRHQWQLLKAIAHSDGSNMLTSGGFIKKYNLTNASTVKRGVDSLLEKEMIYQKNENFYVYDVFFSRWLEMQSLSVPVYR
ncbi:MAG: ATP-binding protein [Bacteroidales bacterium]